MIAFAEWLPSDEWPVTYPAGYSLSLSEYEAAVVRQPKRG
ncbi:hypothetical protein VT84_08600 [Gemmata sp. SH-PL17]|nr:hypothetical protein VT84_08600 [Gemmata sp. SH-PL17]